MLIFGDSQMSKINPTEEINSDDENQNPSEGSSDKERQSSGLPDFEGATLTEAMNRFRQWRKEQQ